MDVESHHPDRRWIDPGLHAAQLHSGSTQTAHKKSNRSCPFCPHAPRTLRSCSPFCECCQVTPTQHHYTACEQCADSSVSLCHHSNVSQRGERLMPVFALPARTRSWGSVCAAQQHHKQLQGRTPSSANCCAAYSYSVTLNYGFVTIQQ